MHRRGYCTTNQEEEEKGSTIFFIDPRHFHYTMHSRLYLHNKASIGRWQRRFQLSHNEYAHWTRIRLYLIINISTILIIIINVLEWLSERQ